MCAKDSFGIPVVSLMVLIAYTVRDWRYLQLTIAIVSALSLVSWEGDTFSAVVTS